MRAVGSLRIAGRERRRGKQSLFDRKSSQKSRKVQDGAGPTSSGALLDGYQQPGSARDLSLPSNRPRDVVRDGYRRSGLRGCPDNLVTLKPTRGSLAGTRLLDRKRSII